MINRRIVANIYIIIAILLVIISGIINFLYDHEEKFDGDVYFETGKYNVIIGYGSNSNYNYCILIGPELSCDHDYQLKLGNIKITKSKTLTNEEYVVLVKEINKLVDKLDNTRRKE